jgi:hypothetical protein
MKGKFTIQGRTLSIPILTINCNAARSGAKNSIFDSDAQYLEQKHRQVCPPLVAYFNGSFVERLMG